MDQTRSSITRKLSYLYEGAFVLNISLAVMATIFLYARTLTNRLFQVDALINRTLHIPQRDVVWGYWALFLPGALLAVCLWFTLKPILRSPFKAPSIRFVTGTATLTLIPLYWLCARFEQSHRKYWSPFHSIEFYELVLVLLLIWLANYFGRNTSIPLLVSIIGILLHYDFWFQKFGTYYIFAGNSGAIALIPIVGLASALAWVVHNNRLSRTPTMAL
jgi:hypothetical protein